MAKKKKWPMPKNAHYSTYCCYCKYWSFKHDIGCAHVGECTAIEDYPTEQDAYDPPCGLYESE